MAQVDGHRIYPVNRLVMHHSVGPEFVNSTDMEVQDWFSAVGRNRGYAGYSRSYHDHPQRLVETFAQAQFALRVYTKDNNKYGYRLTMLMKEPWKNVAWHASNWAINQQSIGIETCGNYVAKKLPEKALMLVADFWRPQDNALKGNTFINPHSDFIATACPGQIKDQLPILIDMVNNPAKWNAKLWPTPVEPPVDKPMENDTWYRTVLGKWDQPNDGNISPKTVQIMANKNNPKTTIDFQVKKMQELEDDLKAAEKVVENQGEEIRDLTSELAECKASGGGMDPEMKEKIDETHKTTKETNIIVKAMKSAQESIINWLKSFGK